MITNENSEITQRESHVNLGNAGDFAILSKTGITNVPASVIIGDVGSSPITGAAILVTCDEVPSGTGTIYSVDAAGPACKEINPTKLGLAVLDMQAAYTDLAGRSNQGGEYLNRGAGNIGGETFTPGVHNWGSNVIIPADITISGNENDIWIFQVTGTLDVSAGKKVILLSGAKAENIFWQVAGAVTCGTSSHFEGNILGKTGINLQTDASINGRLLAQTAVTLQMNKVTKPE
jgi:hypothetical protein